MQPPQTTQKPAPARTFELGDLATNRILFALTLLGVLLPLNTLVNHYHGLNFVHFWPHAAYFKGPYHVRAVAALYLM